MSTTTKQVIDPAVSSMPKKPALGPGDRWGREKVSKVKGRVIEIGWRDCPEPMVGLVVYAKYIHADGHGYVRIYSPASGEIIDVSGPTQVRRISESKVGVSTLTKTLPLEF